jgi:hypothetical protein
VECPGYRDPLDLMFRDQSQQVESRVRRSLQEKETLAASLRMKDQKIATTEPVESPMIPWNGDLDFRSSTIKEAYALPRIICPGKEELVISLVFRYFSLEGTNLSRLFRPCLSSRLKSAEAKALSAAVLSMGHAMLSNIKTSPEYLVIARRKYGEAVYRTRIAIQDPASLSMSNMLVLLFLLAMFEVSL